MTDFASLGLAQPLLVALGQAGYVRPTPIQEQGIPPMIAGRDILGIAQTGTGKTAAFALPILQRFLLDRKQPTPRGVRALVLAPTRELAAQIADGFRTYGKALRPAVALVVGGVGAQPQIKALARGVDVLVATPGRLLDHLQSGAVRLDACEVLILDEGDHMLDLGFLPSVRRIVKTLPRTRQTALFSATMPDAIVDLANGLLRDPVRVEVAPVATTAERVDQSVYHVGRAAKRALLVHLLRRPEYERTLVFTRTKRGADRVAETLDAAGIGAAAIHGNKSQSQRTRALDAFKSGEAPVLVATDIAARGIDVSGVSHVVNFELPDVPEAYVHRIGRTARAGATGIAVAFCDGEERGLLKQIERTTRQTIPVAALPTGIEAAPEPTKAAARPDPRRDDGRRDDARRGAPRRPNEGNRVGQGADGGYRGQGVPKQGRPQPRPGQPANSNRPAGADAPRRRRRRSGASAAA